MPPPVSHQPRFLSSICIINTIRSKIFFSITKHMAKFVCYIYRIFYTPVRHGSCAGNTRTAISCIAGFGRINNIMRVFFIIHPLHIHQYIFFAYFFSFAVQFLYFIFFAPFAFNSFFPCSFSSRICRSIQLYHYSYSICIQIIRYLEFRFPGSSQIPFLICFRCIGYRFLYFLTGVCCEWRSIRHA